MRRVQNSSLRPRIWIIQREINLEFNDSSLEQTLFYKVHAVPSRQRSINIRWNRLPLNDLRLWLLYMRGSWEYKHAYYWVLLKKLEIKFQYLISGLEFLLHLQIFLEVGLLPLSVDIFLFFLLEIPHKLLECLRNVLLLVLFRRIEFIWVVSFVHFIC